MNFAQRILAMIRPFRFLVVLLAFIAPLGTAALAQSLTTAPETKTRVAEPVADTLGRNTPRGTVEGYLDAIARQDYERAGRYLDLGSPAPADRETRAPILARQLKQLLDREGQFYEILQLSNDPLGNLTDERGADVDSVGRIGSGTALLPILLERYDYDDGDKLWLVSNETLQRVPFMLSVSRQSIIDRILPQSLLDWRIGSVSAGHWLAIGLLVFVALGAGHLLSRLFVMIARRVMNDRYHIIGHGILRSIIIPLGVVFGVWIYRSIVNLLGIQVVAREAINWLIIIATIASLAWLAGRLIDAVANATRYTMDRTNRMTSIAVVMLARRLAKTIIFAIAAIVILDIFGVDVTTGLAALGIGGLALALGAQKTVENLVGSITVVADKPVRVGDFCAFGTTLGTVEDIGIRSTRLRTLDRTLVTIPNGAFASTQIENYTLRDRILFRTTLNMRYETTPEQMRWLLVELRALLYAHEMVNNQPARARFIGLGAHSLDIEIFAYIETGDYNLFLEVQEDLLLRIMDVAKRSGSDFAFPSQTLYVSRDGGLDEALAKAAEADVETRRDKGDLGMPRFEPDRIAELDGTIGFDKPKGVS